ncbi:flagellar assembly protein FliH [Natribacillus halophilus]|uniref:Flagellar assembly protein FliH n=2 Tax=Natribacillus halophilus TaxID=549003 RepID=A0A1G8PNS0_9BACI|nr:flagellar assembly protein FliH [Natribacillus halophilus]
MRVNPRSVMLQPMFTNREGCEGTASNNHMIADARKEAETILAEARAERKAIHEDMETSRAELEQTMEKKYAAAKSAGEKEGFRAGEEKGYEAYRAIINDARDIVTLAREEYQHYLDGAEPVIIDVAMKLSEKILGEKLEQETHWLQFVKQALQEVKNQSDVAVYVHPDRYEETVQQREEWLAILSNSERIRFFPDADLDKNDCIVETPYGRLAASLKDQLTALQTDLYEKLAAGRSP